MFWAIFGIFHSMFRAAYAEVNRMYHVDHWQMSFSQSVIAIIVMLPLLPLMHWPGDANFYLAAVLVAMIISIGVVIQLNLNAIQKGRTSSVSIPLEAISASLIWVVITPYALNSYIDNPMMTACVVGAFALATASLIFIRKSDFSWESVVIVAPVGITFAVAGVVTKLVVPTDVTDNILPACLSFVLVNYVIMTLVLGAVLLFKGMVSSDMVGKPMLRASFYTGLCAVMAYISFVASVVYAPNPGYTSILAALVPVWLMWYHEMRSIKDKANPLAALMIAAAIILLIFATWN